MAFVLVKHDETMALSEQVKTFLIAKDEQTLVAPSASNFASIKRNILPDFSIIAHQEAAKRPFNREVLLAAPSVKETMRVFLRIKPKTQEESRFYEKESGDGAGGDPEGADGSSKPPQMPPPPSSYLDRDGFDIVSVESDYQVAFHAPSDSQTYKNCMNGAGTLTHRYTFTKVFPPDVGQTELFHEMVLPRVQDFLQGQNQLMFTYGATSSGKTFTIQGNREHPGIVPRALDVLFNSIESHKLLKVDEDDGTKAKFRPVGFGGVLQSKPGDVEKLRHDKRAVVALGKDLVTHASAEDSFFSISNVSSSHHHSAASSSEMSLQSLATMFPNLKNRVRERGSCSEALSKDDDSIRYSVWISFAEIYNENIHDLLEKLPEPKHKGDKPRRSPLKLAEDRGGAVFIRGLKEIPVSSADEAYQLLMIGRQNLQFAATRLNQHSSRSHCIFTAKVIRAVDTDRPKLARTSMLSFCDLAGSERIKKTLNTGCRQKEAGNINTSLLVLGRCIKALRFNQSTKDHKKHQLVPFRDSKLTRLFQSYFTGRGKASMVVNISQSPYLFDESLQVLKFSAIASRVTVGAIHKAAAEAKRQKRKTRFSILMEKKVPLKSVVVDGGRGSFAWEKPPASSTLVRGSSSSEFPGFGAPAAETIFEGAEEDEDDDADETVIDHRYDSFLKVIEGLEKQLTAEKQKTQMLEKKLQTVEVEVRKELSEEFSQLMVTTERNWEQRLQDEKDRVLENNEWRLNKLQDAYNSQKRKRARLLSDRQEDSGREELLKEKEKQVDEVTARLEEKAQEAAQLESKVSALKDVHRSLCDDLKNAQEQLSRQAFQLSSEKTRVQELEEKISRLNSELKATNKAMQEQNSDPKVQELQSQLDDAKKALEEKEKENAELLSLLNEAGEEYMEKDAELKRLKDVIVDLKKANTESGIVAKDLSEQITDLQSLLNDANSRMEEKDLLIFELEEKSQRQTLPPDDHAKWTERKAVEQELSQLNDEVETLKEEKGKLNCQLADAASKDEEIGRLETEVKNLIQSSRFQAERNQELQSTITMMKKQLSHKNANLEAMSRQMKQKQTEMYSLQSVVHSSRIEDSAIEVLRSELELKNQERAEMNQKLDRLQADVVDKEYDAKRAREERENLMHHYEKLLKDKLSELSLEKRESVKLRETMAKATPNKRTAHYACDQELPMLREELKKKSELVRALEAQIPSPLSHGSEILKKENYRLIKEIERLNENHAREMEKVSRAHGKIIEEYKEVNEELQKHVATSDGSFVEGSPGHKGRGKRGRARKNKQLDESSSSKAVGVTNAAATQVSFDDSNMSNAENADPKTNPSVVGEGHNGSGRRRPKRGSRMTRNTKPPSVTLNVDSPCASEPLSTLAENECLKTPTTGKKKLFAMTHAVEVFTPPEFPSVDESPRSIVTRQLRSRRSKKP